MESSKHANSTDPSFLNNREQFLDQVLQSIYDYAIFTVDKDGLITSWNTGAAAIFGYNEKEILNRKFQILYTTEDIAALIPENELEIAQESGRALNERYHVRKDRTLFWASGLIFPLRDSDGNHQGFTKVLRNKTPQKNREDFLIKAKEQAETLVSSSRSPLIVLNEDLVIQSANLAFYNAFELNKADVPENSFLSISKVLWELEDLEDQLRDVVQNNTLIKGIQFKHVKSDQSECWFTLDAYKLIQSATMENQYNTVVVSLEDITKQKETEKLKDEFIAMASHELKTPVASLKGFVQLLIRQTLKYEDTTLNNFLYKLNGLTNQLTNLIEHVLDVSKISSGKLDLQCSEFDLNAVVSEALEDVCALNEPCSALVEGKIDRWVKADRIRVYQVLVNLIGNAIKYSPERREVIVHLEEVMPKGEVKISVQDFGIGVSLQEQKKLFQAFNRTQNAIRSKIPGIGLGLHIAAEIIRAHQGEIGVISEEGAGSTFWFTLPACSS